MVHLCQAKSLHLRMQPVSFLERTTMRGGGGGGGGMVDSGMLSTWCSCAHTSFVSACVVSDRVARQLIHSHQLPYQRLPNRRIVWSKAYSSWEDCARCFTAPLFTYQLRQKADLGQNPVWTVKITTESKFLKIINSRQSEYRWLSIGTRKYSR